MTPIQPGSLVVVRTADGKRLRRRATTTVVDEHNDFPVVYVTTEEEWAAANGNGNTPTALPWPAEDVELETE